MRTTAQFSSPKAAQAAEDPRRLKFDTAEWNEFLRSTSIASSLVRAPVWGECKNILIGPVNYFEALSQNDEA